MEVAEVCRNESVGHYCMRGLQSMWAAEVGLCSRLGINLGRALTVQSCKGACRDPAQACVLGPPAWRGGGVLGVGRQGSC